MRTSDRDQRQETALVIMAVDSGSDGVLKLT